MSYEQKYLKYKNKYLELQELYIQMGGEEHVSEHAFIIREMHQLVKIGAKIFYNKYKDKLSGGETIKDLDNMIKLFKAPLNSYNGFKIEEGHYGNAFNTVDHPTQLHPDFLDIAETSYIGAMYRNEDKINNIILLLKAGVGVKTAHQVVNSLDKDDKNKIKKEINYIILFLKEGVDIFKAYEIVTKHVEKEIEKELKNMINLNKKIKEVVKQHVPLDFATVYVEELIKVNGDIKKQHIDAIFDIMSNRDRTAVKYDAIRNLVKMK
jgi:hypothetical protein